MYTYAILGPSTALDLCWPVNARTSLARWSQRRRQKLSDYPLPGNQNPKPYKSNLAGFRNAVDPSDSSVGGSLVFGATGMGAQ